MSSDKITLRLIKLLDFLTVVNPLRTALGMLVGLTIYYLTKLFTPTIIKFSYIDLKNIDAWMCIVFGIFLLHLTTIIKHIFSTQKFTPEIEAAFATLRELRKQGAQETEINLLFRKICEKVLQSLEFKNRSSIRRNQKLIGNDPSIPV